MIYAKMSTPLKREFKRQQQKFQKYIERYMTDPELNWAWLCAHPLIDFDFIKKWNKAPWSTFWLNDNPSLTPEEKQKLGCGLTNKFENFQEFFKSESRFMSWCIRGLSLHDKNIVDDVKANPDFPWDWNEISLNENITEDFVRTHINMVNKSFVCMNRAVSVEFLKKTAKEFKWQKTLIAVNPNLNENNIFNIFPEDLLKKTLEIREALVQNQSIPLDFFLSTLYFGWSSDIICERTDITKEHILKYPDFPWDWNIISGCSSIDKNFLRSHPKTNMTVFYRYHSGLTIDEVEHLHPRDIDRNLLKGTVEEKAEYLRRYYAFRKIEKMMHDAYWFTDYAFCRKRLEKRYSELFGEV